MFFIINSDKTKNNSNNNIICLNKKKRDNNITDIRTSIKPNYSKSIKSLNNNKKNKENILKECQLHKFNSIVVHQYQIIKI